MADAQPNTDTSTLATSKKMEYAKLHAELAKLNKTVEKFGEHVKDTVEQAPFLSPNGYLARFTVSTN